MNSKPEQPGLPTPETHGASTSEVPAHAQVERQRSIDSSYAREAGSYFTKAKEDVQADPEVVEYMSAAQKELSLLSVDKNLDNFRSHPGKAAVALSELAGTMGVNNPYLERNKTGTPDLDKENEQHYRRSKQLFMKTGAKLFPDARSRVSDSRAILHSLRNNYLTESISHQPGIQELLEGAGKLSRESAGELALSLDDLTAIVGDRIQTTAFNEIFRAEDPKGEDRLRDNLAIAAEALYSLQLIRDGLQEKVYGRSDVTSSEASAIDATRTVISGERTKSQQVIELPAEDRKIMDSIQASVHREIEQGKVAEVRGAAQVFEYGPALEAMQGVWQSEKELVTRLKSLAQNAKQWADQQISAGKDPVLAKSKAPDAVYEILLPAEKAAFEAAIKKDIERQRRITTRPGGLPGYLKTPPQRLLGKLLSKVYL